MLRLILEWEIKDIGLLLRRMSEFGISDEALGSITKVLIT
jgi:hypothetical protein